MYQIYFILEWLCTCFGRSFRPSSVVQDCTYSKQTDTAVCLLANRQQYLFDICLLLYYWWWMERPSETCTVSFQNKINFNTLVHLVGFTIGIILRCTALWTSKLILFVARRRNIGNSIDSSTVENVSVLKFCLNDNPMFLKQRRVYEILRSYAVYIK